MKRKEPRAGRSAQQKYDELTKAWRRRKRRMFLVVNGVCGCTATAAVIVWLLWPASGFSAGVFVGGALAVVIIARLSPPGWIENWQLGAWGEEATEEALRPLEDEGWVVLHDLAAEHGNIDHVVVGPAGVFLLDSKRLDGTVVVAPDGNVTVTRADSKDLSYRLPGDKHLLHLARQTHEAVRATSRINIWVQPIMVLWADFPQRAVERQCTFVIGSALSDWLRAQPQRLAPERVDRVAIAVASSLSSAGATPPSQCEVLPNAGLVPGLAESPRDRPRRVPH